ncbi:MAG: hypothetical protein AB7U73_23485 [Pirellulales bacterium]
MLVVGCLSVAAGCGVGAYEEQLKESADARHNEILQARLTAEGKQLPQPEGTAPTDPAAGQPAPAAPGTPAAPVSPPANGAAPVDPAAQAPAAPPAPAAAPTIPPAADATAPANPATP